MVYSERTRGSKKLICRKFCLNKLFLGMMVKHCGRLPREAVQSPVVHILEKHGHSPALTDHPVDLVISRGLFQPW